MSPVLELYGKADCHLCHELKEALLPVARRLALDVREIDISGDVELTVRYGWDIPVLRFAGREVARHRATAAELSDRIEAIMKEQAT